MGDLREMAKGITAEELAKKEGVSVDAIRARWNAKFREIQFDRFREMTAAQCAEISRNHSAKNLPAVSRNSKTKNEKRVNTLPPAPVAKVLPVAAPQKQSKQNNIRAFLLYALMAIPAVASIQNMHRVTFDIAGHEFTALLLTGLFSASPFLFVLAGMRNRATVALVGILIAYECFCNFTRIYGGLTGFGHDGFPTRFLGLATDIFNSGTRGTALLLAGIMSAMAAAVFYVAFSELNKKR